MVKVLEMTTSVCPSGSDLATLATPIDPLAPLWFSITTGWPNAFWSRAPITLAMTSLEPPAANGTTRVICRDGNR